MATKKDKALITPDKSAKEQGNNQFKKGKSGNSKGRPKGIKNKQTLKIEEQLESRNCNPIYAMIDMVEDSTTEPNIKAKLLCELASYIYPKRKAIEHTGPDGQAPQNNIIVEVVRPPEREND